MDTPFRKPYCVSRSQLPVLGSNISRKHRRSSSDFSATMYRSRPNTHKVATVSNSELREFLSAAMNWAKPLSSQRARLAENKRCMYDRTLVPDSRVWYYTSTPQYWASAAGYECGYLPVPQESAVHCPPHSSRVGPICQSV